MSPKAIFTVLAVALVAGVNGEAARKIGNNHPAAVGEFPYQASLRVEGQHFCGGAIVSPRHIITAAHCVANTEFTEPLTVVIGTISSSDGEEHATIKTDCHPQFTSDVYSAFDIAVITLRDDIVFNRAQNKIALPTAPAPAGVETTATGWGYISGAFPKISPTLNKIQLPTISKELCQDIFGYDIPIYSNQVCTYSKRGSGICTGDSGGPLTFNGSLIGIASWAVPCAMGAPDVFTSVYHLLPWVNSIINT